jgi:hypothetical protein
MAYIIHDVRTEARLLWKAKMSLRPGRETTMKIKLPLSESRKARFFQIRQTLVKPLKTAFSREVVDSSGKIKLANVTVGPYAA